MFFQALLVEWLASLLRAVLKARPSVVLEKITWRKVVFVAALLVATAGFAQLVSLDFAFFMAGDIALYCEILSAVMFVVVRGHVLRSAQVARYRLNHVLRRTRLWRARRRRKLRPPKVQGKSVDDEGGWVVIFGPLPA